MEVLMLVVVVDGVAPVYDMPPSDAIVTGKGLAIQDGLTK